MDIFLCAFFLLWHDICLLYSVIINLKFTTMKNEKIVLFDNTTDNFDEMKADYCEAYDKDPNEVTEQQIWNYISEIEQIEYDDMKADLEKIWLKGGTYFVARNTFTSPQYACYYGTEPRVGYMIFETVCQLLKCLENCDYVTISIENGILKLKGSHHDGNNEIDVRLVTEKGYEIYNNWNWNEGKFASLSEFELYDKLFNSNTYSKKITC